MSSSRDERGEASVAPIERCCSAALSIASALSKPPFAMMATAPGAASALGAVGCQRAILAREQEPLSNQPQAGPEPAPPRTASVQAPAPVQRPMSVVPASGMEPLLQARLGAKARLRRQRPWVVRDPAHQQAALSAERLPAAA